MSDIKERLRRSADDAERGAVWSEPLLWREAADLIEAQEKEIERLTADVIAFGALWATQHARSLGLPEGHLHPKHYDLLQKAGARMKSFVRADEAAIRKLEA